MSQQRLNRGVSSTDPRQVCECGRAKKVWHLACSDCWFSLPKDVRDRVWKLYKTERGSEQHRGACYEALRLIRERRAA
jgi:hypothetical protein